jgi:hypothetical protein
MSEKIKGSSQESSDAAVYAPLPGRPDSPHSAGWRPISSAPRDGTHILACQANTSFGWFDGAKAPEVQTVVHWWGNPGEEGFYTSVNELAPEHPFAATHWKPLDGLIRDPGARCGRCGARHIEHDLEPVGFTCPDREGVFAPPVENSAADGAERVHSSLPPAEPKNEGSALSHAQEIMGDKGCDR